MFVCAGNGESFDFATSIGVGLIESAINLTLLCESRGVEYLVFVGSAGSYSKNIELLEVFSADCATQIEMSRFDDKSYTPLQNQIKNSGFVSHETIEKIDALNLPRVVVNSSNYISMDESFSDKMTRSGILLENMEFFSVLSVAKKFQIPARGIFCVSNYCDAFAHQEFLKNQKEAIEKLYSSLKSST